MSYCASLQTWQVENVLANEAERLNQEQTADAREAALELYQDARETLAGRDVSADSVLMDRGIEKP